MSIGKTHLVKMLYLVEVEHYRQTGERLTDLKWKFYYYGPYAHELEAVLAEPEFSQETKQTRDEKTFIQIKVAEAPRAYGSIVDAKTGLLVKRVVAEWGNKSLGMVLDYVYFETEPMQAVQQRGEELDFSSIKREPLPKVIPLKASKEAEARVGILRDKIAARLRKIGEVRPRSDPESDAYFEALQAWDESAAIDENAVKRIRVTINPQSNSDAQGS